MKLEDLYDRYLEDELEIQLALSSIIKDEKLLRETVRNYQLGKSQDLIYAEKMLAAGASFGMVEKAIRSNIKRRAAARPKWNQKLRKALIAGNRLPDKKHDYDAHHIIAKSDRRAKDAVDILLALGIDIDDVDNGVFLPKNEASKRVGAYKSAYIHGSVHTKPYFANINFQVLTAYDNGANQEEMRRILRDIGQELQQGRYPINYYMPGAEAFA